MISVPLGILMSLPCINRKSGAAGKKTMLVATIAPVIAPTWPPPLFSFAARKGPFSPSLRRTLSMFTFSLPPRPMRFLGSASVIVAQAMLPRGITTIFPTLTSPTTSKSTWSPFLSVADERFLDKRSFTGVPSSKPNPASAGTAAGAWAAGVDDPVDGVIACGGVCTTGCELACGVLDVCAENDDVTSRQQQAIRETN